MSEGGRPHDEHAGNARRMHAVMRAGWAGNVIRADSGGLGELNNIDGDSESAEQHVRAQGSVCGERTM